MSITHQREAPKLELALALTLGTCIRSYSALAPAISEKMSKFPGRSKFPIHFNGKNRPQEKAYRKPSTYALGMNLMTPGPPGGFL